MLIRPSESITANPVIESVRGWVYAIGSYGGNDGTRSYFPQQSTADVIPTLLERLRSLILPWCPVGSDPGLCITTDVPVAVVHWGIRCKHELVTQTEARLIAADAGIHLEGLGGTEDGIIGALAAIGLNATKNDGRVVYFGPGEKIGTMSPVI